MKCSKCDSMRTRVIDSRVTEKGYTIRRRRVCESCSFRFTTYEYVFDKKIIIKKNGVRQEYDRIKLENSIRISCTKRPISEKVIQETMMKIDTQLKEDENRYTMLCYKLNQVSDLRQAQIQDLQSLVEKMDEDESTKEDNECIISILDEKLKMLESRISRL